MSDLYDGVEETEETDFDLKKNFKDLLEDAGYEPRSYSGRFMYGDQCVGVTLGGENLGTLVGDLIHTIMDRTDDESALRDLADRLSNVRTDSMGRGIVVYFPGVKWS
jgi:hypothetical protein